MGELVYLDRARAIKQKKLVIDGVELDIEEDEEKTVQDITVESFETIFGDQNEIKE
jgi:hypothetical protein